MYLCVSAVIFTPQSFFENMTGCLGFVEKTPWKVSKNMEPQNDLLKLKGEENHLPEVPLFGFKM